MLFLPPGWAVFFGGRCESESKTPRAPVGRELAAVVVGFVVVAVGFRCGFFGCGRYADIAAYQGGFFCPGFSPISQKNWVNLFSLSTFFIYFYLLFKYNPVRNEVNSRINEVQPEEA